MFKLSLIILSNKYIIGDNYLRSFKVKKLFQLVKSWLYNKYKMFIKVTFYLKGLNEKDMNKIY